MPHINGTELSSLIGDIYDCSISGNWKGLLEQLRFAMGSNKAFFALWNAPDNDMVSFEMATDFDYDPAVMECYLQRFPEDPWYQSSLAKLEGEINCFSDEIPIEQIQSLSIYQDVFVPMKTHHCVGATVVRDGVHDGYVVFNRGADSPAYDEHDLAFLAQVTPHLRRAANIHTQLKLAQNHANILTTISQATRNGLLVCDESGRILSMNPAAQQLLTDSHHLVDDSKTLSLHIPYLNKRLRVMLKQNCFFQGEAEQSLLLEGREDSADILIGLSPLKDKYFGRQEAQACCLVTLSADDALNWDAINLEYELTAREVELLQWIYKRKSVSCLADEMGIKVTTARSYIQNIYKKLHVSTQMDLMVKLSQFKSGLL